MKNPYVSVIVLNYFGEKLIENVLKSLTDLNYPKNSYEIIVVDNNSKDKSREILERLSAKIKNLKLINLPENYGFSKGNNAGIKEAKGDFVVLLNNDCIVEKNWLKELIVTALKDPKIFAVNSKILKYPKYLNVSFSLNPKLVPVYAWLSDSKLMMSKEVVYLPFWKTKKDNLLNCKIEACYDPKNDEFMELTVLLNSRGKYFSEKHPVSDLIKFENKNISIIKSEIRGDDVECRVRVNVKAESIMKESVDKVQNAGIMVFQDGYARDIGALVRDSTQYYENDEGQYNEEKEVYAACGASVLYRRNILEKAGLLDESFFMYYEDVDISEKARFSGYKIIYSPKSSVRHFHALSSKEASPFFVYNVERGRLMHVLFNFPLSVFLTQYFYMLFLNFAFLIRIIFDYRRFLVMFKKSRKQEDQSKIQRRIQILKALWFFPLNAPWLLIKKFKTVEKSQPYAIENNYKKIISGDWYFR